MVNLCLTFWGTAKLLSKVTVPFYIFISNVRGFQSFHFLINTCYFHSFFSRFYLFLDRGEGREKERERNITVWLPLTCPPLGTWPATQAGALDWELNQWPFDSQAGTQPLSHTSQGIFFFRKMMNYHILNTNWWTVVWENWLRSGSCNSSRTVSASNLLEYLL